MRRTISTALNLPDRWAPADAPALDAVVRARFREGDPEAVRAVYRAYGRPVYAVAHRVLRDQGLSEEATQETFVKAWRSARRVDPSRELGPWLMTIAKRVAIDIHRREACRPVRRLDSLTSHDPALVSPRRPVEELHDIWDVRRAILALPHAERQVIRLQHLEGLAHTQIAERLAIPLGTVKSRAFRAHRRLAAALEDLAADRSLASRRPRHENRMPGPPVPVCE